MYTSAKGKTLSKTKERNVMKTYFYTVEKSSNTKGTNRTVNVYRNINNQPIFIGSDDIINTASYKGDRAIACKIIHDVDGAKWLKGREGYELHSKNIRIIGL